VLLVPGTKSALTAAPEEGVSETVATMARSARMESCRRQRWIARSVSESVTLPGAGDSVDVGRPLHADKPRINEDESKPNGIRFIVRPVFQHHHLPLSIFSSSQFGSLFEWLVNPRYSASFAEAWRPAAKQATSSCAFSLPPAQRSLRHASTTSLHRRQRSEGLVHRCAHPCSIRRTQIVAIRAEFRQ